MTVQAADNIPAVNTFAVVELVNQKGIDEDQQKFFKEFTKEFRSDGLTITATGELKQADFSGEASFPDQLEERAVKFGQANNSSKVVVVSLEKITDGYVADPWGNFIVKMQIFDTATAQSVYDKSVFCSRDKFRATAKIFITDLLAMYPLPEPVEDVYKGKNNLQLAVGSTVALGDWSKLVKPGLSFNANYWRKDFFFSGVSVGGRLGAAYFSGNRDPIHSIFIFPLEVYGGYQWSWQKLSVKPYLGCGIMASRLNYKPEEESKSFIVKYYTDPLFSIGIDSDYQIFSRFTFGLSASYSIFLERSSIGQFVEINLFSRYLF